MIWSHRPGTPRGNQVAIRRLGQEQRVATLEVDPPECLSITRLPNVISNASGDFVLPNVPPDIYTLEINLKGFKTLKRPGIAVSPGDRIGVGAFAMEVGGITDTVTVTAESTLLQTQSAERSATITPTEVQNLPLSSRVFTNLAKYT
jgi:hypothetical protein